MQRNGAKRRVLCLIQRRVSVQLGSGPSLMFQLPFGPMNPIVGASLIPGLLLALLTNCSVRAAGAEPNALFARTNLVAWCIVPFDSKKRGPEERASMLERLGFKLYAYDYRAEHIPTFDAEMDAVQRHGITLIAWWFPGDL